MFFPWCVSCKCCYKLHGAAKTEKTLLILSRMASAFICLDCSFFLKATKHWNSIEKEKPDLLLPKILGISVYVDVSTNDFHSAGVSTNNFTCSFCFRSSFIDFSFDIKRLLVRGLGRSVVSSRHHPNPVCTQTYQSTKGELCICIFLYCASNISHTV